MPREIPPDHDDYAGRDVGCSAAFGRDRTGFGTATAARHDDRRRTFGVADSYALHDAGDLRAARPIAPTALGQERCTQRGGRHKPASAHADALKSHSDRDYWKISLNRRLMRGVSFSI